MKKLDGPLASNRSVRECEKLEGWWFCCGEKLVVVVAPVTGGRDTRRLSLLASAKIESPHLNRSQSTALHATREAETRGMGRVSEGDDGGGGGMKLQERALQR